MAIDILHKILGIQTGPFDGLTAFSVRKLFFSPENDRVRPGILHILARKTGSPRPAEPINWDLLGRSPLLGEGGSRSETGVGRYNLPGSAPHPPQCAHWGTFPQGKASPQQLPICPLPCAFMKNTGAERLPRYGYFGRWITQRRSLRCPPAERGWTGRCACSRNPHR